ncbi:hypothetical protein A2U01_0118108 [Trifolium medium]|uniref:Uncharacterized protein n=1 Tax=Trifolium medium TaxID=97028 RepID=A0A392W803_9FABA|nr:hypothetical protein [Trifolium medium]
MVPGAVLEGRQLSPGEVVARLSPVVSSCRQWKVNFLPFSR